MSDNKRKAVSQVNPRPSKKPQLAGKVKVKHLSSDTVAKPVIANCPAGALPTNLKFDSYSAKRDQALLLHSSTHDTIDYTATETRTTSTTEAHTKHYVAVYDPTTSQLVVTEAKKMVARTRVRQVEEEESESEEEVAPTPGYAGRTALTEAFGTKKSRKAVQAMAENRLMARGGGDSADALSTAIRTTVHEVDEEIQQDAAQNNKPLPPANIHTDDIHQVYPISSLAHPTDLSSISIAKWEAFHQRSKPIACTSHFISNRLNPLFQHRDRLASTDETAAQQLASTQLHVARYLEFLILFHRKLTCLPARKRLPKYTADSPDLTPLLLILPFPAIKVVITHFFPEQQPTTFAMTLLRATILALALHIPPAGRIPATNNLIAEPTDLARDLGKDVDEILKLYKELGCKIVPLTDTDATAWNLTKLKGKTEDGEAIKWGKVKIAKLRVPVEFPKVSMGRREKKRR